ncbi:MAG TPA: nitrate/sulfonate/bicarbonate ABC transporter ATP-binding protein [Gammaproteobacteria bacterium]|nr:nitrate/sulfonate/bicarbonate ABC transporter ATP-binding protein [Gammaproteobacteria bacterium]
MPKNPLVEVKNLRHSYPKGSGGDFLVLDNINLSLYEDEIVCLLGRSGSGKSTLLRCMSGLIRPSEGSVTMQNVPLDGPRSGIAMVFQSFALYPWLTVLENVELGLEAQRVAPDESKRRASKAIDLIGLDGSESAYPRELSGGMQQRVGLARALVVKPNLLLMDEPFSALDVLTAEILRADLLDLWIEGQLTIQSIVMVTHSIEEAVFMADRVVLFGANPGRIIDEINITMPQPRNRLSPEFRALVDDIYDKMIEKSILVPSKESRFAGTGIGMVLPYVSTNILQGFIETLFTVYNGSADLPKIAETLVTDGAGGEVLIIAETLQLFRFCELDGADVHLTPKGAEFAAGNIDQRKKIFHDHLRAYIPLAARIRSVLEERKDHMAPFSRFRDEIEDYMPDDAAEETMKTVISWARYAELFAYNEQTGKLYIESDAPIMSSG